jgi:hypothetical protein
MFYPFKSIWAQITLVLTIISLALAYVRKFSAEQMFIQTALLLLLGRDTYCISTGKCNVSSWTIILFPLAFIVYYGLEAMGLVRRKLGVNSLEKFRRWNQMDFNNVNNVFPILTKE